MELSEKNRKIIEQFIYDNIDVNSPVIELGCRKGDTLEYVLKHLTDNAYGVEGFSPYVYICRNRYLPVVQNDIINFLKKTKDFVDEDTQFLLIETLECLFEEDGKYVIETLKSIGSKILVFSSLGYIPKESYKNNEHEKRRQSITDEYLQSLGFKTKVIKNFHEGLPKEWSSDVVFGIWQNEKIDKRTTRND